MSNEEQIKELNDRLNRMIEEKYNLCCECERLVNISKVKEN